MAERLSFIKLKPRSLWDLSAWWGASEPALGRAYPDVKRFWYCDEPAIAQRSRAELQRSWWQRLVGNKGPQWREAGEPADVVWANMSLHACPDLPSLLARWNSLLSADGFLMFSCLGPDTGIELRNLYRRQAWGRPAPAWWDMHDLGDLMVKAGFADPVMDQERLRLTWAEPEAMLADLRALGGNLAPDRFGGLRGRRWKTQLIEALQGLRDSEGRLALTVELVYGHAFKAAPRLALKAETQVSLETMRSTLKASTARAVKP